MEASNDQEDQKKKLEELIRRKEEGQKKKRVTQAVPESETCRYEELIRNKSKRLSSKEKVFNTAFCVEIKQEEERVLQIIKDPMPRPEAT